MMFWKVFFGGNNKGRSQYNNKFDSRSKYENKFDSSIFAMSKDTSSCTKKKLRKDFGMNLLRKQ